MKILFASLVALIIFTSACSAKEQESTPIQVPLDLPVGSEFRPCDGCPTFVRAPDAPENLRRILFVAEHELTWAGYFASVKVGKCPVPASFVEAWPNETIRDRMVTRYQLAWPAAYLSMSEVDCFVEWVGEKTGLVASLPSPEEWEWFASAGDEAAKFPWGNGDENPPAAVKGVEIDLEDRWPANFHGYGDRELLSGVRVGIFPPNKWGIYDLIGNTPELTTKTESGTEHMITRRKKPEAKYFMQFDWVLLKGVGMNFDDWRDGIAVENWTYLDDGRPKTSTSVRLVLIEEES